MIPILWSCTPYALNEATPLRLVKCSNKINCTVMTYWSWAFGVFFNWMRSNGWYWWAWSISLAMIMKENWNCQPGGSLWPSWYRLQSLPCLYVQPQQWKVRLMHVSSFASSQGSRESPSPVHWTSSCHWNLSSLSPRPVLGFNLLSASV